MTKYLLFLTIFVTQFKVYSQRLPNKQEISFRAPTTVKIDGRTDEWNDQFQAFNHATEIYYVIANDDHYIYFIAKAMNAEVINKLYTSTLEINITGAGLKEGKQLNVAFPVYEKNDLFHVNLRLAPKMIADSPLTVKKVDSFLIVTNKLLSGKAKWISVTGIKELDSVISVYNENGIKAAAAFNRKMEYAVEFAIDLKYIKEYLNPENKIRYHIISRGLGRKVMMDNVVVTKSILPNGSTLYTPDVPVDMAFVHKMEAAHATTDFWGEYTLAK